MLLLSDLIVLKLFALRHKKASFFPPHIQLTDLEPELSIVLKGLGFFFVFREHVF